MSLDSFLKPKKTEERTMETQKIEKVEWDGKDFRGDKCQPQARKYMREHPLIFKWLRKHSANTINSVCSMARQFFNWAKATPEKFLMLDKRQARDLAWEFIETFVMKYPVKALHFKAWIVSFYLFHNEERLIFIKGKHDIIAEPKRQKHRMSKKVCWQIIDKTLNLRDETILLIAYESGLRRNAIAHMTYGHYKNFKWYLADKKGQISLSNADRGNIVVLRVAATPNAQFTHDNKLRGKGINWYYACLHKEACQSLRNYIRIYHEKSLDNDPLWFPLVPLKRDKAMSDIDMYRTAKRCVKRARLPSKQIDFHSFRRGFRGVVRNTAEITDAEFKEAIMGHKLKGAQSAYFDKDPLEFAREYAKCDFSRPTKEKDEEIKRLREELAEYKTRVEQPKEDTTIKEWERQYLQDQKAVLEKAIPKRRDKPQEFDATTSLYPHEKMGIVNEKLKEHPQRDEWLPCPYVDDWVKPIKCETCKALRFKTYSDCQYRRIKNPNDPIFQLSKPKP